MIPEEDFLIGPSVQWDHVDGPLLTWAGGLHWLTWWERLQLRFGWSTVDAIACRRWPRRAQARAYYQRRIS